MKTSSRADELEQEARAAYKRDQYAHAALFYERARALAIERGAHARAFYLGRRALEALERSGDYQRYLTLLSSLLHEIPEDADPNDVYWVKNIYCYYLLGNAKPRLDKIVACADELDSMRRSLGRADSGDISYRRAEIANVRGMWQEAITHYEIAWSRHFSKDYDLWAARQIISPLLRLERPGEARRWAAHITSDQYPHAAQVLATSTRVLIALHDNDVATCKGTVLAADDAMSGTEWKDRRAGHIWLTVAALALDQDLGDPLASSHPSSLRLAEFPRENLDNNGYLAHLLHETAIILRLAGLRYAAGIAPVDDLYYCKPHQLQPRGAARLPEEISARVLAARKTCDDALPVAIQLDTGFQCTFRQDDIDSWRARVDEIAAAYGL